jgi:DNA-binding NarL/FixJ family response regulator
VNDFPLFVRDRSGANRRIVVSLFSIPAVRPSLSSVVHVLREDEKRPITLLERELIKHARQTPAPRWQLKLAETHAAPELTAREREILRCMAEELGTAEIAKELSITAVTVRNHTQNILQKLEVHTKLAAVVYAFRHNLIL